MRFLTTCTGININCDYIKTIFLHPNEKKPEKLDIVFLMIDNRGIVYYTYDTKETAQLACEELISILEKLKNDN